MRRAAGCGAVDRRYAPAHAELGGGLALRPRAVRPDGELDQSERAKEVMLQAVRASFQFAEHAGDVCRAGHSVVQVQRKWVGGRCQ
jgi:hypothetical protein